MRIRASGPSENSDEARVFVVASRSGGPRADLPLACSVGWRRERELLVSRSGPRAPMVGRTSERRSPRATRLGRLPLPWSPASTPKAQGGGAAQTAVGEAERGSRASTPGDAGGGQRDAQGSSVVALGPVVAGPEPHGRGGRARPRRSRPRPCCVRYTFRSQSARPVSSGAVRSSAGNAEEQCWTPPCALRFRARTTRRRLALFCSP